MKKECRRPARGSAPSMQTNTNLWLSKINNINNLNHLFFSDFSGVYNYINAVMNVARVAVRMEYYIELFFFFLFLVFHMFLKNNFTFKLNSKCDFSSLF